MEELGRSLQSLVTARLASLSDIWEKMGLDDVALNLRHETVRKVLDQTLTSMVEEEETTMGNIVRAIEKHYDERGRLAKELEVPLVDPDQDVALIKMEHILRTEAAELRAKKEARMREVLELKREDEALCRTLDEDAYYVSSTMVPTTTQFDGLKAHIARMKELKTQRLGVFAERKAAIVTLLESLEAEPESSFERTVVCEDDASVVLSEENLLRLNAMLGRLQDREEANRTEANELREKIEGIIVKLNKGVIEEAAESVEADLERLQGHSPAEIRELKTKLSELEVIKSQRIGQFIHATRMELQDFWDKCYYSQEERDKFEPFYAEDYTEELLEKHESEVEAIKTYYHDNLGLFRKIEKRQTLWRRMIELEELQKDPQRLKKAKGPQLLEEERDKKRINKQLPKLEDELQREMAAFEESQGCPFLVGGVPYAEFIEAQVLEHQHQQMAEKTAKAIARKEQNIHETIYGTVTPAKGVKRKMGTSGASTGSGSTPYNKRANLGTTTNLLGVTGSNMTRSMARSPYRKNVTKSGPGRRAAAASNRTRRALGDRNDSVVAGNTRQMAPAFHPTITSIDSDNFLKDMPKTALTSTFNFTPETKKLTRAQQMQQQQASTLTPGGRAGASSTPKGKSLFKTPSSRVLTPGNKKNGDKKLALRSARQLPFLL